MDELFSGVYIVPLGAKSASPSYEIAQPHRHDFYYCVLLSKGSLELEVNFVEVQVTSQMLFLSYPGQVHRITSAKMEQGWFLAFEPAIIEEPLKNILDQCLSEVISLALPSAQLKAFSALVEQVYAVRKNPAQLFKQNIIQALVTAFIYQVASAYLSIERVGLLRHSARAVDITKKFKQLLRHNFKAMKKPSEFAAELNITASHLNDTVKSVTGFSITYYIQQELMREAQRLLSQPDLTIKEIADSLGFEDAKYFTRLFSKVTGVAPGAFRKRLEHLSV